MLDKKQVLKKMLSHFSSWMDIRRKPYSSNGGKLISAISDETESIQEAIDDYVDFHFFNSNIKNEEAFISHAYSVQIGADSVSSIQLISPNLKITENLDEFYKQDNLAYYQDGFLFMRMNHVKGNVQYTYEGYLSNATPTIKHVWNIFDEFAMFIGLERYELENNASLIKRIILSRREKINSTKEGLQYAIYSALATLDESLSLEEVLIETPTASNMNMLTEQGTTIIDEMGKVNRDIYRFKRWDIDNWNHDFDSSSYLPHQWDYPIDYFKNGIGDNEDLKTYLLSRNEYVSATVKMYQKDEESMLSYINDNKLKESITLALIKPLDTINPISLLYKITAHNLVDITPNNVGLKYTGTVNVNRELKLSEIIDVSAIDTKQFEYVDRRRLVAGRKYKVNIAPIYTYGNFNISKCQIRNESSDTVTDLLEENGGLVFENHTLVNPNLLFFGNKTEDFDTYSNMIDTPTGLNIINLTKIATVTKSLEDCSEKLLQINTTCSLADVEKAFIMALGFELDKDTYKSTAWNSSFTVELKANFISLVVTGNATVKIYKDNALLTSYFTNGTEKVSTPTLPNPTDYKIIVTPISQTAVISISNVKYTSYELLYSTEYGKPTIKDGMVYMPKHNSNTLKVSMITNTNFSPTLLGVHVGGSNENLSFNSKIFTAKQGDMLDIDNDFSAINLSEYDSNEMLISTQADYMPTVTVKAISDSAVLELNLADYVDIETLLAGDTTYKVFKMNGVIKHYLYFKRNMEINSVYVKGTKKTKANLIYFNELFEINLQNKDKIYISNAFEGLLVLKNNQLNTIKLNEYPALKSVFSSGSFEIINYTSPTNDHTLPNSLFYTTFVKTQPDGSLIKLIGHSASGSIANIYFMPKDNLTYVAHNKFISYKEEEKNVAIVNTFYPFIQENELYLYKAEPVSDNLKICFYDSQLAFDETRCFSIGNKPLHLLTNFDVTSDDSINSEKKYVTKQVELYHSIELSEYATDDEENLIDLKEYLIKPPNGMSVFYYEVEDDEYMIYPEAFHTQKLIIEEDGFSKLNYCHINRINSVRLNANNGALIESGYELIKELGIVKWDEVLLKAYKGQTVYINFKVDLPLMIVVSDDIIYKSVEKIEKAHKLIKTLDISLNVNISDTIDLSNNTYYTKSDFVTISFKEPGYVAEFKPNHIKIKKIGDTSELAIHSGYYYHDGKEYFMFSNATQNDVKNIACVTLENIDKINNHILTYSYNENYVENSKMVTDSFGSVYHNNFLSNHSLDSDGISHLNYISACDSFSKWALVGMNIKLAKGINGQGLMFNNLYTDSYALLDITDTINDKDYVSCYISNRLEFYIASEPKYAPGINIKHVYHIDQLTKIEPANNLIAKSIEVNPDRNYYIIVKGSGILDDLIICDPIKYRNCKNIHTKNIDYFNIAIEEDNGTLDNINRLSLTNQLNKHYSATIDQRGYIVNASNIDWTLTKFKTYEYASDWSKCNLKNITIYNDLVKTNTNEGILITDDIYIGNPSFVNKVIIKINDIIFEQMDGIELEVLGANSLSDKFKVIHRTNLNNVILEETFAFMKIKLNVPANKIVKNINIYIDYKSDGELKICENNSGYYVSELFDMQKNSNIIISDIGVEDITQPDYVKIFVRGAKENFNNEIFSEWQELVLSNKQLINIAGFENTRYLQFKILLNNKRASIKINYFEVKVG